MQLPKIYKNLKTSVALQVGPMESLPITNRRFFFFYFGKTLKQHLEKKVKCTLV